MSVDPRVETLRLLASIDASLKLLVARSVPPAGSVPVADDRDLDSGYGDPVVRFNPRDWHGENCKGRRYSECPAEFLDLLAGSLEYFARKSEQEGATTSKGKPKAEFERRDAARARGWAARKRAGWTAAEQSELERAGDPAAGDPFERSEWPEDGDQDL